MEELPLVIRKEMRRCGQLLVERGLVWGRSGNISARADSDAFLISAGGSELGSLQDDDLILCRVDKDTCEGVKHPSMESQLHREIYRSCSDAVAIIHSQPFYSTLVSCSDIAVRTDFLPEAMTYLGDVARVSYHHAGSRELAQATAAKTRESQVLLLENHGVVCWGSSLDEALLRTEALDFVCRLLVLSRASGLALNFLGEDVAADFLRHLRDIGR
jgi:ribulose-5-phosphate 4-epimerase/fuculose-1-phosphate aldolase